jgi:hypothetical protein
VAEGCNILNCIILITATAFVMSRTLTCTKRLRYYLPDAKVVAECRNLEISRILSTTTTRIMFITTLSASSWGYNFRSVPSPIMAESFEWFFPVISASVSWAPV